jgi:hypothetical protein
MGRLQLNPSDSEQRAAGDSRKLKNNISGLKKFRNFFFGSILIQQPKGKLKFGTDESNIIPTHKQKNKRSKHKNNNNS